MERSNAKAPRDSAPPSWSDCPPPRNRNLLRNRRTARTRLASQPIRQGKLLPLPSGLCRGFPKPQTFATPTPCPFGNRRDSRLGNLRPSIEIHLNRRLKNPPGEGTGPTKWATSLEIVEAARPRGFSWMFRKVANLESGDSGRNWMFIACASSGETTGC